MTYDDSWDQYDRAIYDAWDEIGGYADEIKREIKAADDAERIITLWAVLEALSWAQYIVANLDEHVCGRLYDKRPERPEI